MTERQKDVAYCLNVRKGCFLQGSRSGMKTIDPGPYPGNSGHTLALEKGAVQQARPTLESPNVLQVNAR